MVQEEKTPKKRTTFKLKLTQFELIHLRDLFGVRLPPELSQTISQALATLEDRNHVESRLWGKVVEALKEAGIPRDDDAPDYLVAAAAPPPVGVFKLAQEPSELLPKAEGTNPFGEESESK